MTQIRNPRDFASGAFLALFAAFILWSTWHLPVGSGVRLGPGFVPLLLGSMVGLFGFGIMLASMVQPASKQLPWTFNLRAAACILAALAAFGLLVERSGLLVASPALVLLASLAFEKPKLTEVALLIIGLTAGAIGLFHYALGLTIPVLK